MILWNCDHVSLEYIKYLISLEISTRYKYLHIFIMFSHMTIHCFRSCHYCTAYWPVLYIYKTLSLIPVEAKNTAILVQRCLGNFLF